MGNGGENGDARVTRKTTKTEEEERFSPSKGKIGGGGNRNDGKATSWPRGEENAVKSRS